MRIARRALLRLLGASGLMTGWSVRAARRAQPFFLLFDDITPDIPAEALAPLLAAFLDREIPVGLVVKPGEAAGGTALAAVLRATVQQSPGLAEIIAWLPDLGAGPPYFQIRAASQARARLAAFLSLPDGACLTVASENPADTPAVDALRAAGFRNALLLSQTAQATLSDRCVRTTACLRGSLRAGIDEDAAPVLRTLRAMIGAGDMTVLALSLQGLGGLSPEALGARAAAIAGAIAAEVRAGRAIAALPKEHVTWFGTGVARLIGLALEMPGTDPAQQAGFGAMQARLTRAGLPFDLMTPPTGAAGGAACRWLGPPQASTICAPAAGSDLHRLAEAGVETVVQPVALCASGIDGDGLLHLPSLPTSALDPASPDPLRDIVLTIPASAYATEAGRAAVMDGLRRAKAGGASVVLSVSDLAKTLRPDDPVYRLMLATRRDGAAAHAPVLPAPTRRAALLEDAQTAWSYFAAMTDAITGLCASTIFDDAQWPTVNTALTMWDYGSLIQATLAALELNLISRDDYLARAAALLRGLPAESIAGLTLPSAEIASDSGKATSHDYNACDTGRLLIALDRMNRHPLSRGLFTAKVAGWDLAATLDGDGLRSVSQGRLQPLGLSHCAQYAARAFTLWGIAARSPHDPRPGDSQTDARMRLLYEVARIGPLGAEPLLLEGIELGFSAPSAYLADVLFAAQQRSFATDGKLRCVSEGPMNRAPWFTYQGLRVDGGGDPWDVVSIDDAPAYQTPRFRAAAQSVSTKAAFLWAALRPGNYSARLLDHVRKTARASRIGYASGVYVATGAAMTNYADINTNAVILQAIAYSLRGGAPAP